MRKWNVAAAFLLLHLSSGMGCIGVQNSDLDRLGAVEDDTSASPVEETPPEPTETPAGDDDDNTQPDPGDDDASLPDRSPSPNPGDDDASLPDRSPTLPPSPDPGDDDSSGTARPTIEPSLEPSPPPSVDPSPPSTEPPSPDPTSVPSPPPTATPDQSPDPEGSPSPTDLPDGDGDGHDGDEDCDDTRPDVFDGAPESCDGIDNDCDGSVDDGVTAQFFADADRDTYGNPAVSTQACTQPIGYVTNSLDCDDTSGLISPEGEERCNDLDDDCDGTIDEAGGDDYYADTDGDGFGDPTNITTACSPSDAFVADGTDCDDSRSDVHPGALELCDEVDQNCDGELGSPETYYIDADGDTFGAADQAPSTLCAPDTHYVKDHLDCNDGDATEHPMFVSLEVYSDEEPGTYSLPTDSIQAAVDAPLNCQRVLLDAGVYRESVSTSGLTGLSIQALYGAAETGWVGDGTRAALSIADSSNVTLSGFYLTTDGYTSSGPATIQLTRVDGVVVEQLVAELAESSPLAGVGGALNFELCSDVEIRDSQFRDNSALYGGAIGIVGSTVAISGCTFEGNDASGSGGAIAIRTSTADSSRYADVSISDSYFYSNSADLSGGAVYADQNHVLNLSDSYLESNYTNTLYGGALYNPTGVDRSTFVWNEATGVAGLGGAILLRTTSELTNCIFYENATGYGGGAVAIVDFDLSLQASRHGSPLLDDAAVISNFDLTNNTFVNNSADAGQGHAVYFDEGDTLLFQNNLIYDDYNDAGACVNVADKTTRTILYNNTEVYYTEGYTGENGLSDAAVIGKDGNTAGYSEFVALEYGYYEACDLHLGESSAGFDTGNPDPAFNDADGSRNDMGAYGGPESDW